MKKFYLPLLCMGFLSGTLFSQNTYITGNVPVKVQSQTLFYHGGNFVVTDDVTNGSVIINDGNIKINGSFSNAVSPGDDGGKGANFVNTYTDGEHYGQIIINDGNTPGSTSTGMLTMVKQSISPLAFTWGQFAIPYQFSTAKEAYETLFVGQTYKTNGRYNHSIMTWDNTTRPEYDHIPAGTPINPTDYVLLNLTTDTGLIAYMDNGAVPLPYAGEPANGIHNVSFRPAIYPATTTPWSTWKATKNIYNEKYETYIEEHIRVPQSADHGRYYFQFGNPYTSNIDLSFIGRNDEPVDDGVYVEDLLGVVKITSMEWDEDLGVDVENVGMVRATWDGSQWGGSANALIIKPFEGFYIGLKSTTNRDDRTFNFNDGLKTFSMVPALTPDPDADVPAGRYFEESEFAGTEIEDKALSSSLTAFSIYGARTSFYQLRLSLYTEDWISTGNNVYVIVDSKSQTGIAQPLESDYTDFTSGFFLTQENANGSEVILPNRVMQINAVHPKYVAKPIQLFFKTSAQDFNGYYLKAELFYKDIFTKLGLEDVNFADGNSFFFYDKAQDVLLPITADFSYYIEREAEPMYNRYTVYWNGGPEVSSERMSISEELTGTTQVYKDGNVHKIRFNESWTSADIAVYDLAGRAIHKQEGVKTDVDYVLDLPKSIVYVVKIQSNTGEIVTQKIIK